MDHNLDMDNSSGVKFDHAEDSVISEVDIGLGHMGEDIPMEFEHTIEEQPLLMESGNEEIIVSDFMGGQFALQDYTGADEPSIGTSDFQMNPSEMVTQNEASMDLNIQNKQNLPKTVVSLKPKKYITLKTSDLANKSTVPRPVAIAPKPSKSEVQPTRGKPIVIPSQGIMVAAPKSAGKQILTSIQNAVIKQVGNNPASFSKLKLVTSGGNLQYAQIIPAKSQLVDQNLQNTENTGNVVTKIFVQGQQGTDIVNQAASISNVQTTAKPSRLIAFHQKASGGNPVIVSTSPSSQQKQQQIKVAKKQFVAIKSPNTLLTGNFTKKFIITGNSTLKINSTAKSAETVVTSGTSKTQYHRVNVPGKGIQYIQISKPEYKPKTIVVPAKNVIMSKGSISMNEKVVTAGPPPLVFTGNAPINKLTGKPQQKLVRIAPLGSKTAQAFLKARASQSLLAPMKLEKDADASPQNMQSDDSSLQLEPEPDSKDVLTALIADTVAGVENASKLVHQKVEIEYEAQDTEEADISLDTHDYSTSQDFSISQQDFRIQQSFNSDQEYIKQADFENSNSEYNTSPDAPLIVIPSNFVKQYGAEVPVTNLEDVQLEYSEPGTVFTDVRPRKACNCTKSQCLKLYCDCFANGEFCNNCNCINCHNNLTYEELRQKAIRGCLDRNPNAFRPKIGKAKGGIDIVRRHNKGCNCKRSGCLKNYCECFEAKIACSANCKCVGCRNVADSMEGVRRCDVAPRRLAPKDPMYRPPNSVPRQPCSFMSNEVVEAVCQCLIAAATEADTSNNDSSLGDENSGSNPDPIRNVIEEFSRCLQDIIGAAHQPEHVSIFDETHA